MYFECEREMMYCPICGTELDKAEMAKVKMFEFKDLGTRIDMIAWNRQQVERMNIRAKE
jgi:hypothetical protein